MRPTFRDVRRYGIVLFSIAVFVWIAARPRDGLKAQAHKGTGSGAVVHVRSTPENVVFGAFPIDRLPVQRVASGSIVRIDTLSHRGTLQQQDPVAFLGALGVKPDEVLQDVKDVWASRNSRPREGPGGGGHILTGPIYVEGAAPGDTLAVEIRELTTRVPYGINATSSTTGVFAPTYGAGPGDRDEVPEIPPGTIHLIRTGMANGRAVAFFSDKIQVPMNPFMGTMAVAPDSPKEGQPGVRAGVQTSGPPGPYGGNMDFREFKAGSTLYLPVFQPGALFYVGDPHGTQADGEVSGNALEQSLTGVFRFTVLKGKKLRGPRGENRTHYFLMGIDLDLDRATRKAVLDTIDFLVQEKGLTPAKALSLCSIGIDFRIAEIVDGTQVVVGYVPKSLFLQH